MRSNLFQIIIFLNLFLTFSFSSCKKEEDGPNAGVTLEKVSGDNQTGFPDQPLADPIKVKVVDKKGAGLANRTVAFELVSGEGKLDFTEAISDQNGVLQVNWTIGPSNSTQILKATLKDNNGSLIPATSIEFSTNSKVITVAGGRGKGNGSDQLNSPNAFYVDGSGNIYISDVGNYRIQKWVPGATSGVTVVAGNSSTLVPAGVFVDAKGDIYVCSYSKVQKFISGSNSGITVAGGVRGYGSNDLLDPTNIFVDSSGNLFIVDKGNHRVQKWPSGGGGGTTVAGGSNYLDWGSTPEKLLFPSGIYVDGSGSIYIADAGNDRIQKWLPNASAGITVAGGNGKGNAANQLSSPGDVFVDKTGNIYVADYGNQRIQLWAPGANQGITVAGGNGIGSAGNQMLPYGVSVDNSGNIYVLDGYNNRVQKWLK